MKKYKRTKNIFSILLIISMSFVLTGCIGGGGEENDPPQETTGVVPTDRQVSLIWWNLFEPQENMQEVIDAYQAIHPNVTIEYSQKTIDDYKSNLDKVLTDGQAATTPDIFTVHNTWVPRYQNYTLTAPSEVIDYPTYQANFYPVVVSDGAYDGSIHSVPLGVDSLALIYNKKLLNDAGYTVPSSDWFELLEQAKAMTVADGQGNFTQAGLAMAAYENTQFWFGVFNLLLLQSDVTMVSEQSQAVFADDPATLEAVDYFQTYTDERVWDEDLKQDVALFLEGKLAMFFAPSWRLLDVITYVETYGLDVEYDVATVPQLSSLEESSIGWADYWMQMVSRDSTNYKVAWDFLNFASQPEQLRLSYNKASESRAFGQIYPRVDMKSELQSDPNLGPYLEEISHAQSWKMVDGDRVEAVFRSWLAENGSVEQAQSSLNQILNSSGYLTAGSN